MKPWPLIPKNSIVDIIAPSGRIEPANIVAIRDYVFKLGLTPRIPDNLLGDHPFSANTDEIRFEHLQRALNAEDSTLIWCVRGGHGVTTIMPMLTQMPEPKKQKLLVGFSDITSLHLWLNQAWHWPSLHGPMARQVATGQSNPDDVAMLTKIWFEGIQHYQIPHLQPMNQAAQNTQPITGITAGTCLSLLQTSLGTPWQIDARQKILFLEDINEYPYRIDRLLIHLVNAKIFDEAAAIIFGDFGENLKEPQQQELDWALKNFAENYLPKMSQKNIPCFRSKGFGHEKRNRPTPLGVNVEIKNNVLSF